MEEIKMLLNKNFSRTMSLGLHEAKVIAYGEQEAETKVLADGTSLSFSAYIWVDIADTTDGAQARIKFYDSEVDMNRLNASLNAILEQVGGIAGLSDIAAVLEHLKANGTAFKVVLKENPSKDDPDKVYTNFYFDVNTIKNYSRRAR